MVGFHCPTWVDQLMPLTYHRKDILSHFTCQNTGKCCLSPGYVYVNQENIASMSKELNVSIDFFMNHFVTRINGWNVIATPTFRTHCFLDTNQPIQEKELYQNDQQNIFLILFGYLNPFHLLFLFTQHVI